MCSLGPSLSLSFSRCLSLVVKYSSMYVWTSEKSFGLARASSHPCRASGCEELFSLIKFFRPRTHTNRRNDLLVIARLAHMPSRSADADAETLPLCSRRWRHAQKEADQASPLFLTHMRPSINLVVMATLGLSFLAGLVQNGPCAERLRGSRGLCCGHGPLCAVNCRRRLPLHQPDTAQDKGLGRMPDI